MIITRAPLRICLAGGGTDLPFYSSKFGGSTISAALDKYVYIIVEKREFYDHFLIRYMKTETPKTVKEIQHTRIKAALEFLNIHDPIEITSLADVPAGTGLGSSSTFLVALLKALHTYKREEVSAKRLAEEAAHIEMEVLKEPIGKQDQYISAYGGVLNLDYEKNGNVLVSSSNISHSTLDELQNNTLLFYTGVKREAADIIADQKKQAELDDSYLEHKHVVKDVALQIRKALESGDAAKFGKWMNVHWETKKKFSDTMTSDQIDKYYELGLKNGAIGGKLVGAGGGGFLLFYCENNKQQLRRAMDSAGLKELPFKFDTDGCKVVYNIK